MISNDIVRISLRLKEALDSSDYDELILINQECDAFFKSIFPLDMEKLEEKELAEILLQIEKVTIQYVSIIAMIEEEKINVKNKLMSLGKNKINTNRYLDIAEHL